jgi:hypothetical protein
MFVNAVQSASGFTRPVVISRLGYDGQCSSIIGAYIVLNKEGWIATAWHIMDLHQQLEKSIKACSDFDQKKHEIETSKKLTPNQRKGQLRQLPKPDDKWTRAFSFWFGNDKLKPVGDVFALAKSDLAVCKLDGFDPAWVSNYPQFKDSSKGSPVGTSVCKLGYPFHTITPTHSAQNNSFELPPDSVPPPFFPIDGIVTRNIQFDTSPAGYPLAFLETSSPGLRGQSGGPIFDKNGVVWAIQSQTAHYPLGFNPPVPGKKDQVEHQFLNVGLGVHHATITGFLKEIGVAHDLANY